MSNASLSPDTYFTQLLLIARQGHYSERRLTSSNVGCPLVSSRIAKVRFVSLYGKAVTTSEIQCDWVLEYPPHSLTPMRPDMTRNDTFFGLMTPSSASFSAGVEMPELS